MELLRRQRNSQININTLLLHFSGKCLKGYTETIIMAFQFTKQAVDTAYLHLMINIFPLYCSYYI